MSNAVSSSEEGKGNEEVTTTTKNEDDDSFNSEEEEEDDDDQGEGEEEDDGSSTTVTTSSSPPKHPPPPLTAMPSFEMRPSLLHRPPTITVTEPTSSLLRPSKLLVPATPLASSSSSPSASSTSATPVFIPLTKEANGEAEVKVNGNKKEEEKKEFLFGEKLEDRAREGVKRKHEEDPTSSSSSVAKVPALEDADVTTGEEDEVNVVQINVRLYTFDNSNWTERVSRGVLRLNDTDDTNSRLIVRTQGSLRLMLNSKLFEGMVVERPTEKSVKFTGVQCNGGSSEGGSSEVRVFLVMGSPLDMDSLYGALKHRLARFNTTTP